MLEVMLMFDYVNGSFKYWYARKYYQQWRNDIYINIQFVWYNFWKCDYNLHAKPPTNTLKYFYRLIDDMRFISFKDNVHIKNDHRSFGHPCDFLCYWSNTWNSVTNFTFHTDDSSDISLILFCYLDIFVWPHQHLSNSF